MSAEHANADPEELARFDEAAEGWWDPAGEMAPLHRINPLRLDYIERRVGSLSGKRALDAGCGGGLLAEGLAARGATVTGIDLAERSLEAARRHAREHGLDIDYRTVATEAFADEAAGRFDVVACLEMLEHVPDPPAVVNACARLVRPGGHVVFSTLNRNCRSWLFAIVAAERILHLLPRGTHQHERFIRPAELARWAREPGLVLRDLTGIGYQPLTGRFHLQRDVSVNYLAHFTSAAEPRT